MGLALPMRLPKEKAHKIDRSKTTSLTIRDVDESEIKVKIFELLRAGKSNASIAKELKIDRKKVTAILREEFQEISLAVAELKTQYIGETLTQVNYLIEHGLALLDTINPKEGAGLWKTVVDVYMKLAEFRLSLLGGIGVPQSENKNSSGAINVLNVGPVVSTIANSKENPLVEAAYKDPRFFTRAFQDKYGGEIEAYLEEQEASGDPQAGIEELDDDNELLQLNMKLEGGSLVLDDD